MCGTEVLTQQHWWQRPGWFHLREIYQPYGFAKQSTGKGIITSTGSVIDRHGRADALTDLKSIPWSRPVDKSWLAWPVRTSDLINPLSAALWEISRCKSWACARLSTKIIPWKVDSLSDFLYSKSTFRSAWNFGVICSVGMSSVSTSELRHWIASSILSRYDGSSNRGALECLLMDIDNKLESQSLTYSSCAKMPNSLVHRRYNHQTSAERCMLKDNQRASTYLFYCLKRRSKFRIRVRSDKRADRIPIWFRDRVIIYGDWFVFNDPFLWFAGKLF